MGLQRVGHDWVTELNWTGAKEVLLENINREVPSLCTPPLPCYSSKRLLRKQLIPSSGALIFANVLQENSPDLLVQRPSGIVIVTLQDWINLHTSTAATWGSERPWWLSGKETACNAGDLSSFPGLGRFPRRRKSQPTPVFLPGKSHGQRSLAGYSPWGRKELDTIEHTHTHTRTAHTQTQTSVHIKLVKSE